MIKDGQFLLFDNKEEFKNWLFQQKITRKIKTIQNHHTVVPNYKSLNGKNQIQLCKSMKNYHTKSWNPPAKDIAQTLSVFPNCVVVCRPLNISPAGIYGANFNSICLENIGYFDNNQDIMSKEHSDWIVFVNAVLCMKFNLTPSIDSILYHRWFDLTSGKRINDSTKGSYKTCPGNSFYGGNTIKSAQKNFIPLIENEIKNIKLKIVKEVFKMAFKDNSLIASWSKPSVDKFEKLGIVKGDAKGNFNPNNLINRQEMIVLLDRMLILLEQKLNIKIT